MTKPHYLADILHAIADGKTIQERRIAGKQKPVRIGMTTPTPAPADGWVNVSLSRICNLIDAAEEDGDTIPSGHFRIKPPIIVVNGIEVSEPIRAVPNNDDVCYLVTIAGDVLQQRILWRSDSSSQLLWLSRGLLHSTEVAAEAHALALLHASL